MAVEASRDITHLSDRMRNHHEQQLAYYQARVAEEIKDLARLAIVYGGQLSFDLDV